MTPVLPGGHVLAILLSLVATYVIGFLWHGPVFGKQWMAYNKMTPPKKEDMKFSMMFPGLAASFVQVIVQCVVLLGIYKIMGVGTIRHALFIATILSIAFTVLPFANSYAWEGKKIGHFCVSAGYYLVSIWVVAAILFSLA